MHAADKKLTMAGRCLGLLLLLVAAACAPNSPKINEYLDPVSSATVTSSKAPLIFYRDNPSQAAYARRFLNLGPIAVNRGGHYRYFLWASVWSSIRPLNAFEQRDRLESIIVFVDAEPLALELSGWTPDAIGIGNPVYPQPAASAASAYYEVTIDQIRLIASAQDISISTGPSQSDSYRTWDDQASARANILAFVDYASH